jgi:hypothetical protein
VKPVARRYHVSQDVVEISLGLGEPAFPDWSRRTARANAAERIALEIDQVAAELRQASTSSRSSSASKSPMPLTKTLVQQTIEEMTGLIEHAPMDTRVAWVRDLFERVTVDGREEHAVAIWREPTDEGVNRSDSVSVGSGGRTRTYDQAPLGMNLSPQRRTLPSWRVIGCSGPSLATTGLTRG